MQNEPLQLYDRGLPIRDFVHVLDVVQANLLALQDETTQAIYNVGSGQQMTIKELAKTVLTAVSPTPTDQALTSTSRFRLGDIFGSYANLTHIQRELGYAPEIAFADGLATLLASWTYEGTNIADIDAELRRWGVLQG